MEQARRSSPFSLLTIFTSWPLPHPSTKSKHVCTLPPVEHENGLCPASLTQVWGVGGVVPEDPQRVNAEREREGGESLASALIREAETGYKLAHVELPISVFVSRDFTRGSLTDAP